MTTAFGPCFDLLIAAEGDYTADPRDPGNWTGGQVGIGRCNGTRFGISAAAFPLLDVAGLDIETARALYLTHYWTPIHGDALPPPLALLVFDAAVNQGVHAAVVTLQWVLGTTPDGVIGPVTLAKANGEPVGATVVEYAARRALSYAETANLSTYGLGWMRRLMRTVAVALSKDPACFPS